MGKTFKDQKKWADKQKARKEEAITKPTKSKKKDNSWKYEMTPEALLFVGGGASHKNRK